uniref:Uncharacterized protein n=1 Tax=Ditylenchus dipsaci TaxID=166011 RepID=A0A915D3G7_9BILA
MFVSRSTIVTFPLSPQPGRFWIKLLSPTTTKKKMLKGTTHPFYKKEEGVPCPKSRRPLLLIHPPTVKLSQW